MAERVRVAKTTEIPPGAFKVVDVGSAKLVVYNVDGAYFATTNTCAHQGGPLGSGLFDGSTVTCPWHAWQFDVCSGEAIFDPGARIACYAVHLDQDEILVEV